MGIRFGYRDATPSSDNTQPSASCFRMELEGSDESQRAANKARAIITSNHDSRGSTPPAWAVPVPCCLQTQLGCPLPIPFSRAHGPMRLPLLANYELADNC